MADTARKLKTKSEGRRRLNSPTCHCFNSGYSVKCGISFDRQETSTIQTQKIALWCMRWEKCSHPIFVAPHRATDEEHDRTPFSSIVVSWKVWCKIKGRYVSQVSSRIKPLNAFLRF